MLTQKTQKKRKPIPGLKQNSIRFCLAIILLVGFCLFSANSVEARANALHFQQDENAGVSPGGALLRSFVMPGWGHYAVDSDEWSRGQLHMGADLALIASFALLLNYQNRLEGNLQTFGDQYAGIAFSDRERAFRLAVAGFESLRAYNDHHERTRNWDRLYPETDENYWEWESDEKRSRYNEMRSRRDDIERQAPALLGMMVVNRVIAGINAFTRARDQRRNYALYLSPAGRTAESVQATLRIDF